MLGFLAKREPISLGTSVCAIFIGCITPGVCREKQKTPICVYNPIVLHFYRVHTIPCHDVMLLQRHIRKERPTDFTTSSSKSRQFRALR
jgi:hypothetical protein